MARATTSSHRFVSKAQNHPATALEMHPQAAPLSGHAVQFYETDSSLIEVLGQQLGTALEANSGSPIKLGVFTDVTPFAA